MQDPRGRGAAKRGLDRARRDLPAESSVHRVNICGQAGATQGLDTGRRTLLLGLKGRRAFARAFNRFARIGCCWVEDRLERRQMATWWSCSVACPRIMGTRW